MFNRIVIAALALSVASCLASRHPSASPPPRTIAGETLSLPAAGLYEVDSSASELRILIYRAGPLAALGHNHVVVSRSVSGYVKIGPSIAESEFFVSVPVESFVVDESQTRREEGDDFSGDISRDSKLATRRNMLSGALLDAEHFPVISVASVTLNGTYEDPVAELTIRVAGHEAKLAAPFHLQRDAHRMMATGTMELRHSTLGLTPHSLLQGALLVQDAMQLKFSLAVSIN